MLTQIVFVDGIGGRRYMRNALFEYLTVQGFAVQHFEYRPAKETLDQIKKRLTTLLTEVSQEGDYVLVGYSFGGVLARMLLVEGSCKFKQPVHLILLASPLKPALLSHKFAGWRLYKMLTGECGQVVASSVCMGSIGLPSIPLTCIYGTYGLGLLALFSRGKYVHDGMLSASEVSAESFENSVAIHASHAFIPSNPQALAAIVKCLHGG